MVLTPDDQGPTLWAVNTLFVVLATLSVIGRGVARRLRKLQFGVDDWLTCVALVRSLFPFLSALPISDCYPRAGIGLSISCLCIVSILFGMPAHYLQSIRPVVVSRSRTIAHHPPGRRNGLGLHQDLVPEANVTEFRHLLYYFQIFYVVGPPTIKLSLLFLYKRIFSISRRFLYLIYAVGALVVVWLLVGLFLGIFDCVPIESFWLDGGRCIDFKKFGIGYAIVNITTDFAVWLMPIPSAWKLRLPLGQKIAVTVIFGIGLLYGHPFLLFFPPSLDNHFVADAFLLLINSDCAAAFARLMAGMLLLEEEDMMFYYAKPVMWSIIEISTGVICTCLPTMRVVLRTILRGRADWALGPSDPSNTTGETHGPKYGANRSWLGPNTYSEIECPSTAQASTTGSGVHDRARQDEDGAETEGSYVDTNNGPGGIRVFEEVTVELQPVKPRDPMK